MDEFKDLNLIISEAKRMSNTFRAFERIPRVLEIIQSSSSYVDGLEKTAQKKNDEIANLDKEIEKSKGELSKMKDKVKDKTDEFNALDTFVAEEKTVLMDAMKAEIDEIGAGDEEILYDSTKAMEDQIEANDKAIEKSKSQMMSLVETHKIKIDEFKSLEESARKRADEAVENLEKIKRSLMGGE
jgi:chromosome segregation ATPase